MQLTRYLVLIKMSIEYRVPYQVGTNCLSSTLRSPYIYCYCLILSVTITVVLRSTSITFGSHYYTTRYSVRTCTAVADRRVLLLCFGSPGPWLRPYLLGLRMYIVGSFLALELDGSININSVNHLCLDPLGRGCDAFFQFPFFWVNFLRFVQFFYLSMHARMFMSCLSYLVVP